MRQAEFLAFPGSLRISSHAGCLGSRGNLDNLGNFSNLVNATGQPMAAQAAQVTGATWGQANHDSGMYRYRKSTIPVLILCCMGGGLGSGNGAGIGTGTSARTQTGTGTHTALLVSTGLPKYSPGHVLVPPWLECQAGYLCCSCTSLC